MKKEDSITIGLPVYNGERYLHECIDSIVSQNHTNWKLIISDNASTDNTANICRDYAESDNRISYIRHDTNIGASPNFNLLASEIDTPYFKWIAHDDKIDERFLETCINLLEANQDASLVASKVRFIDSNSQVIEDYATPFKTSDRDPGIRFCEMLKPHPCYEIFGVIRSSCLRKTRLIRNYKHGDGVLLSNLALIGRLIEAPECLMYSRKHEQQSMYLYSQDFEAYSEWFDPRNKNGISLTFNRRFIDYLAIVLGSSISSAEKLNCTLNTFKWLYRYKRVILGEWKRLILRSSKPSGIGLAPAK